MARKKRSEKTISRIGFSYGNTIQAIDAAKLMVRWNPTVDDEYGYGWGGPVKALDLMESIILDVDTIEKEKAYNNAVDEINNFLDFLQKMRYYKEVEYWGPFKPRRLEYVMVGIPYNLVSEIDKESTNDVF